MTVGKWIKFQEGAFKKERWIHTTRTTGWIRKKTKTGKWAYDGSVRLDGADGKARKVRVRIEGKLHSRHRLIALAKDGTAEGLAKFLDWKNNPVEHKKRRREDERPDDTPENVDFGTYASNNADPNKKKAKQKASGHPVILTNATTKETKPFSSALAAAAFLGAEHGNLVHYLNGTNRVKNMPKYTKGGEWDAAYDEFDLPDAVRLVRAAAKIYVSPSRPNRLFRKLPTGKFCATELERGESGYMWPKVASGVKEALHILVVETLRPGAFDAKLAVNPVLNRADLVVYHVDGDQRNNAIDNLEVLTKKEHAWKRAFAVEWIDASGNVLETFESLNDVAKTVRGTNGQPLCKGNIRKVCDRDYAHTGGQRFRWKDEKLVEEKRAAKLAKSA